MPDLTCPNRWPYDVLRRRELVARAQLGPCSLMSARVRFILVVDCMVLVDTVHLCAPGEAQSGQCAAGSGSSVPLSDI